MNIRLKLFQVFSEALIPVLGFLLWDWGLYFILLFYFIDLVADFIITNAKSRKIISYRSQSNGEWVKYGIVTFLIFCLTVAGIHAAVWSIFPEIDFYTEANKFWSYKEMGLEQGYILVPLVLLVSYQQYKMEFLRFRQFEKVELSTLWQSKTRSYVLMIGFSALVLGLSQFVIFDEWIYVAGIVVFSSAYNLLKLR